MTDITGSVKMIIKDLRLSGRKHFIIKVCKSRTQTSFFQQHLLKMDMVNSTAIGFGVLEDSHLGKKFWKERTL